MDDEDNEFIDRYTPFGKPGAGAPLKSHDGHVDTSIRAHPETRFQKHLKKEVENSLVRINNNSHYNNILTLCVCVEI